MRWRNPIRLKQELKALCRLLRVPPKSKTEKNQAQKKKSPDLSSVASGDGFIFQHTERCRPLSAYKCPGTIRRATSPPSARTSLFIKDLCREVFRAPKQQEVKCRRGSWCLLCAPGKDGQPNCIAFRIALLVNKPKYSHFPLTSSRAMNVCQELGSAAGCTREQTQTRDQTEAGYQQLDHISMVTEIMAPRA